MNALKYSGMILLSVFISCSSDDDHDHHHDEPNWVQHSPPQENSKIKTQSAKLVPVQTGIVESVGDGCFFYSAINDHGHAARNL